MSDTPAGSTESGDGGPLRQKFEAARKVALDLVVQSNPGLDPKDFNGIEPDQFVTHAQSLKQQREAQLAAALGVTVDELPAALARAKGEQPGSDDGDGGDTPQQRTSSLGSLNAPAARPDPQGDQIRDLTGEDLIEAALIQEAKQQR